MKPSAQCLNCAFINLKDSRNAKYICTALNELQPKGCNECKFFKTDEELAVSRQKAYDRLKENGLYFLIDQYELKPAIGG